MITLRPFTKAHFFWLDKWIESKRELFQFAGSLFDFPIQDMQKDSYLSDNKRLPFQMLADKTVVGHIEIYQESDEQAKLCRILVGEKSTRGKGIGEAAITLALDHCFTELSCKKVHLNVYDWNISAIKCYEKCGMKINPHVTSITHFENEKWVAINMSITKQQWQAWTQDS